MDILERRGDITSMSIPGILQETCKSWDEYSRRVVVDQIDSGWKDRM